MNNENNDRPSKRFIKHGSLRPGEYHPDIHNMGKTMEERNQKSRLSTYYTAEEMDKMREEIKPALCPICTEIISE